jgi:hypothetical protein
MKKQLAKVIKKIDSEPTFIEQKYALSSGLATFTEEPYEPELETQ